MAKRLYCAFGYECNNNCLHCAVDSKTRGNRSLSTEDVFKILDHLEELKNVEVEISGGEPTCRPELFFFLERLCTNFPHIRHVMLTNGRNFSRMDVASKFAEFNPHSILVPLHGDTPALHDKITQVRGSFDETILGIRNLYDCNLNVGLKTVVNGLNFRQMPELVEMVAQTFPECPGITLNGLEMQGNALKNKDIIGLHLTDAIPHIEKSIDVANNYGLRIMAYSIPPCMLGEEYRKYAGMKKRSTVISRTPLANMQCVKLTYGTIEKCKGCRYATGCTGAWYSYFDVYGTEELKPIL